MRYTPEEEKFLRENIGVCDSYADLTRELNEKFGTERKMERVREKCTKGLHISIAKNIGRFTKYTKTRELAVGTIRTSQTGTYIKVQETPVGVHISGYAKPYWMPYQEKVWTDANGDMPDGHMICFLNHDTQNFSVENLFPITRAESVRMSQYGWWSEDPERTKAAILCCRLQRRMKDGN